MSVGLNESSRGTFDIDERKPSVRPNWTLAELRTCIKQQISFKLDMALGPQSSCGLRRLGPAPARFSYVPSPDLTYFVKPSSLRRESLSTACAPPC